MNWWEWLVIASFTVIGASMAWLLVEFWRAVHTGRILLRSARRQADINAAMRRHPAGNDLDNEKGLPPWLT